MTEYEQGNEYPDNGETANFFARGVLETVKKLRWSPDIIHCQGWMGAIIPLYIKTAYHDEPTFANTKVITSLFQKQMKTEFDKNFKHNVEYKNAKAELLKSYNDKFDSLELCKLAIDYSDGIIEAEKNINADLIHYTEQHKLPILKYPGENYISAYQKMYDEICPE